MELTFLNLTDNVTVRMIHINHCFKMFIVLTSAGQAFPFLYMAIKQILKIILKHKMNHFQRQYKQ